MESYHEDLISVFEAAVSNTPKDAEYQPDAVAALFTVYQMHIATGYYLHRELLTTIMAGEKLAELFANLLKTEGVDPERAAAYRAEVKKLIRPVLDQLPVKTVYVFEDGSAFDLEEGEVCDVEHVKPEEETEFHTAVLSEKR